MPINQSVKEFLPVLQVLKTMSPQSRMFFFHHMDDKTRDQLYAVINHVLLSEDIPKSKKKYLKEKLGPYKDTLRYLSDSKKSKKKKKKKLVQIGGGPMNHVIKAAIPLLLNLFKT